MTDFPTAEVCAKENMSTCTVIAKEPASSQQRRAQYAAQKTKSAKSASNQSLASSSTSQSKPPSMPERHTSTASPPTAIPRRVAREVRKCCDRQANGDRNSTGVNARDVVDRTGAMTSKCESASSVKTNDSDNKSEISTTKITVTEKEATNFSRV